MGTLTENIKKAFEYKEAGDYKTAIDFFYKALTIESNSCEIMSELAELYTLLSQDDRALSFYEQIIQRNKHNNLIWYKYALLLKKLKKYDEAKNILIDLFQDEYEITEVTKELFDLFIKNEQYQELINTYNLKYNKLLDSFVFYYVGLAYEKLNRQQLAEEYLHKSYDMAKDNVKAGISIVSLLFEEKKYDEAEKLANNLLQYSENDRLFYYLAEIKYMNNDYDSALKNYSYAIKLNDKCGLYFFKLGLVYTFKGYYNEAEQSFCNALLLEPDNITFNYALAYLYYINDKILLSEKIIDSILKSDEDYVLALSLKVLIEIKNNRVVFCNELIKKILKSNEKDDFSYYALSKYYAQLAMWKKALMYIKMAIDLNDNFIDYKIEYAQYNLYNSDYDKVIEICSQIIDKSPKYIQAYILLSQAYLNKKDYSLSYDNAKKALNLNLNSASAQSIMGMINYEKCSFEKAIECFKIAALISPQRIENYEYIAKSYYKLNEFEKAYDYYKEASLINVSEAEYYYYMAKCSIELNNKENALSNYSIMHRLAPFNTLYMCDYAEYLSSIGKKKLSISILKKGLKALKENNDRQKIEDFIKKIKKNS